jgi:hypothetical protein
MAKTRKSNRLDGCTFTFFVGLLMVALYVANGVFVRAVLPGGESIDARIYQPIQFGLPIVLIFFEYWIYDRLTRRFSRE